MFATPQGRGRFKKKICILLHVIERGPSPKSSKLAYWLGAFDEPRVIPAVECDLFSLVAFPAEEASCKRTLENMISQ